MCTDIYATLLHCFVLLLIVFNLLTRLKCCKWGGTTLKKPFSQKAYSSESRKTDNRFSKTFRNRINKVDKPYRKRFYRLLGLVENVSTHTYIMWFLIQLNIFGFQQDLQNPMCNHKLNNLKIQFLKYLSFTFNSIYI